MPFSLCLSNLKIFLKFPSCLAKTPIYQNDGKLLAKILGGSRAWRPMDTDSGDLTVNQQSFLVLSLRFTHRDLSRSEADVNWGLSSGFLSFCTQAHLSRSQDSSDHCLGAVQLGVYGDRSWSFRSTDPPPLLSQRSQRPEGHASPMALSIGTCSPFNGRRLPNHRDAPSLTTSPLSRKHGNTDQRLPSLMIRKVQTSRTQKPRRLKETLLPPPL